MKIILLGKAEDAEISELFKASAAARVTCCNGKSVGRYGTAGQEVLLLESERLETPQDAQTVVVLKKSAKAFSHLDTAGLVILSSEYGPHLRALQTGGVCAVTCGLSHKDTVTYSSKGGERSVVSLQRGLRFGEREIEPQEITVDAAGEDYAVLATAALRLLCKPPASPVANATH